MAFLKTSQKHSNVLMHPEVEFKEKMIYKLTESNVEAATFLNFCEWSPMNLLIAINKKIKQKLFLLTSEGCLCSFVRKFEILNM